METKNKGYFKRKEKSRIKIVDQNKEIIRELKEINAKTL